MKPQYDVNDNGQSPYIEPEQKYKQINNTGNANPTIIKKNNKNIQSTIHLILLCIIFLFLIFMLIFVVNGTNGKKMDDEKVYTSMTKEINTYDVDMSIEEYSLDKGIAIVTIKIKNNSDNNIYLSAKGMYLTSTTNIYCANVITSSNSSQFYGQAIQPNETIQATLTFNDVKDDPSTLVITNINDTKHLTWTNTINLK